MVIFDKFKTGDPIKDSIMTTIFLMVITYFFQFINENLLEHADFKRIFSFNSFNFLRGKKYVVEYEGKITCCVNIYNYNNIDKMSAFSDRFKAIWYYIINNISENKTIHSIKEFSFSQKTSNDDENKKNNYDIYMVIQNDNFLISSKYQIYAHVSINSETQDDDKPVSIYGYGKKPKTAEKIEKIKLELFSYKSNIKQIKDFVEELTEDYLSSLENIRYNKKFIYNLTNTKYDESPLEIWNETIFSSNRTFTNLFFNGKKDVIERLDFFLKNKTWYNNLGIPYCLGIGMYGPPGTGKTSLIKAIANYTNRHIITISLKIIKTRNQLKKKSHHTIS
jgi:hypothetical protein